MNLDLTDLQGWSLDPYTLSNTTPRKTSAPFPPDHCEQRLTPQSTHSESAVRSHQDSHGKRRRSASTLTHGSHPGVVRFNSVPEGVAHDHGPDQPFANYPRLIVTDVDESNRAGPSSPHGATAIEVENAYMDVPMRDFDDEWNSHLRDQQAGEDSGYSTPVRRSSSTGQIPPCPKQAKGKRKSSASVTPTSESTTNTNPIGDFYDGDAKSWTPRMILRDVEDLLGEDMPEHNYGAIYAFKETRGRYVKIGYTTQSCEARRRQLEKQSGIKLDSNEWYYRANIKLRQLYRLEKIIHADLAYYQRNLRVPTEKGHKTQHEWFEIDFRTAERCINHWLNIIRECSFPIESNIVDTFAFDYGNEDERQAIHEDYAKRLDYWQRLIVLPKKSTTRQAIRYFDTLHILTPLTDPGVVGVILVLLAGYGTFCVVGRLFEYAVRCCQALGTVLQWSLYIRLLLYIKPLLATGTLLAFVYAFLASSRTQL